MKLFIKLFVSVIALLILALVILLTVVNPNDYKEEIQAQATKILNRELLINGDLNWTFLPQIGFSSGEIVLVNAKGFNRDNLIKIESAAINLDVFPLFKGEIKIGELTLNGFALNLITNKDGISNLDNMLPEKSETAPKETEEEPSELPQTKFFDPKKLQLAGITIENAQIEVQDLTVGSTTKVDIDHIHLGKFILGKETDLSIVSDLLIAQISGHINLQSKLIIAPDFSSIALNNLALQTVLTDKNLANGQLNSTVSSNIVYHLAEKTATFSEFIFQLDKLNLQGEFSVQSSDKTKVRFNLQGNDWNLNPYLSEPVQETKTAKAPSIASNETTIAEEAEPDLSFLNDLDIKGQLTLASVSASDLKIGKVTTEVEINQGRAQIKPLTAQLYEGLLTVNAWVDDAKGANKYKLDTHLTGVQIYPLLIDANKIDLLSGTTTFNLSANGQGLTTNKIKTGLTGKGDFALVDGELYGINIPHKLRTLRAKLKGKPAPTDADIKKTDFASLTGTFNIKEGIVDNKKLLMLSPIIRLDGAGLVNILNASLDYKLNVTPLSKSGAETELQDLSGITIPLLIKGYFTDLKFSLDTEGALKKQFEEKAKAELEKQKQKLQEKSQQEIQEKSKKLEDKLKKELGKFFN